MHKRYAVVLVHVLLLLAAGASLRFLVPADGSTQHKLLAGFFIGTYSMFGKEIAKLGLVSLWRKSLPIFDKNKLANGFVLFALVILAIAGLFAWAVSWEGSTGVWFGFTVFLAALLSDAGIAPLFSEFYPPVTQHVEG